VPVAEALATPLPPTDTFSVTLAEVVQVTVNVTVLAVPLLKES
jgi:hypothetical protein